MNSVWELHWLLGKAAEEMDTQWWWTKCARRIQSIRGSRGSSHDCPDNGYCAWGVTTGTMLLRWRRNWEQQCHCWYSWQKKWKEDIASVLQTHSWHHLPSASIHEETVLAGSASTQNIYICIYTYTAILCDGQFHHVERLEAALQYNTLQVLAGLPPTLQPRVHERFLDDPPSFDENREEAGAIYYVFVTATHVNPWKVSHGVLESDDSLFFSVWFLFSCLTVFLPSLNIG